VAQLAEQYTMPTENLIPPDAVRRISWEPPDPPDPVAIGAALSGFGARRWQVELTAGPIAAAIAGVAAPQPDAEQPDPG
jgi:ribonuclease D